MNPARGNLAGPMRYIRTISPIIEDVLIPTKNQSLAISILVGIHFDPIFTSNVWPQCKPPWYSFNEYLISIRPEISSYTKQPCLLTALTS